MKVTCEHYQGVCLTYLVCPRDEEVSRSKETELLIAQEKVIKAKRNKA